GGRNRPNYDHASLLEAEERLTQAGLPSVVMVDCSHANSGKQHTRQEEVWRSVIEQKVDGNTAIIGMMLESYLNQGNQPVAQAGTELAYGVSITDACLGWDATERMLRWANERLLSFRPKTAVMA